MMMNSGCCCSTTGAFAVIWLFPGDEHCVAEPTSVQLSGAAAAAGAMAIARAEPPATASGLK